MIFGRTTLSSVVLATSVQVAAAQSLSDRICNSATAHIAAKKTTITDRMALWNGSLTNGSWTTAPIPMLGASEVPIPKQIDRVYLAYFVVRTAPNSGAVSVKLSLSGNTNAKPTNQIELYRSAIDRRDNRCEPRGRRAIEDRSIRVNEYIDYHDSTRGGLSSNMEDFHFNYPIEPNICGQTNSPQAVGTFQFDNVERTVGDTFLARNFSFIGTAYAVKHNFSKLRSELHYRPRTNEPIACVGFDIPLNGSSQASVVIHDLGFGTFGSPIRRSWLIRR